MSGKPPGLCSARAPSDHKEIGAALTIEENTVKMHVRAICIKIGVRNRTEAVIAAQCVPGDGFVAQRG